MAVLTWWQAVSHPRLRPCSPPRPCRYGRGRWGRLDPTFLAFAGALVTRLLLRRLPGLARWVAPPPILSMNDGTLPYRAVRARVLRDEAVAAALAAGAAALAATRWLGWLAAT